MIIKKFLFYNVIFLFLIAISCAVKEAPSGGPEDLTPPIIVSVSPAPGSTNIPNDSKFIVQFSKPMKVETAESAVFLTPVFWEFPEFSWSGKKLTIKPPENLKPDVTYVLTIGAKATDHHGNQMKQSKSFAFSTGAVIDSGTISGGVYLSGKQSSKYDIWAYSLSSIDDPVFLTEIPDYATQIDSIGGFTFTNVAMGTYAVIAVRDVNSDLFWDPKSEEIGLPNKLVEFGDSKSVNGLLFKPIRRDTVGAYISKVFQLDKYKLMIEFSQPVSENEMLNTDHYKLFSDDSTSISIFDAYFGENKRLILEIDDLEENKEYRLRPDRLVSDWGVPFDSIGKSFTAKNEDDNIAPELIDAIPGNREAELDNNLVKLTFSERVNIKNISEKIIAIADSTDTLSLIPELISPNIVRLRHVKGFPRSKDIRLKIDAFRIKDIAGNPMSDSIIENSFKFLPEDTVGTVSARIIPPMNVIGILNSVQRTGKTYKSQSSSSGEIIFESILPGYYNFEYFHDADSNGIWSSGNISPFKFAEKISFMTDSIQVRSRWNTDIGEIDFK